MLVELLQKALRSPSSLPRLTLFQVYEQPPYFADLTHAIFALSLNKFNSLLRLQDTPVNNERNEYYLPVKKVLSLFKGRTQTGVWSKKSQQIQQKITKEVVLENVQIKLQYIGFSNYLCPIIVYQRIIQSRKVNVKANLELVIHHPYIEAYLLSLRRSRLASFYSDASPKQTWSMASMIHQDEFKLQKQSRTTSLEIDEQEKKTKFKKSERCFHILVSNSGLKNKQFYRIDRFYQDFQDQEKEVQDCITSKYLKTVINTLAGTASHSQEQDVIEDYIDIFAQAEDEPWIQQHQKDNQPSAKATIQAFLSKNQINNQESQIVQQLLGQIPEEEQSKGKRTRITAETPQQEDSDQMDDEIDLIRKRFNNIAKAKCDDS